MFIHLGHWRENLFVSFPFLNIRCMKPVTRTAECKCWTPRVEKHVTAPLMDMHLTEQDTGCCRKLWLHIYGHFNCTASKRNKGDCMCSIIILTFYHYLSMQHRWSTVHFLKQASSLLLHWMSLTHNLSLQPKLLQTQLQPSQTQRINFKTRTRWTEGLCCTRDVRVMPVSCDAAAG